MTPDQDPSTLPQKNKSKDHCEARVFKFIAFAALVLLLYLINVLDPTFYGHVFHLVKGGDMEEAVCFLRSYGPWAIVISFFLDVFINAAGFLPSIFMSTANGVVFGLPIGITISWAAESVGVIISFLIMRYFLRATAEKVIIKSNNLKKIDDMSSDKGLVVMALARTLPYFPSGILTCLGAISRMSLRDYVIATFLGKYPSPFLEVGVGHDIVNFHEHMHRLAILTTLVVLAYGTLLYVQYKRHKKPKA